MRDYASVALRLALGLTFLYSVADRFGWLGPPGAANVSWGTFARFTAYVGILNWYLPHAIISNLAWIETALELILGLALVAGLWLRLTATVSALLLLSFGVTMSLAGGIGAPFQYSVFTASAAALLLATGGSLRWGFLTGAESVLAMNRVNDVGGRPGYGAIDGRDDGQPFHHEWEARVFMINRILLLKGIYNLDEFRYAIESMDPAHYASASYYERWLVAIESLLEHKGLFLDGI